jgi:alkylhydroperoxidase/carboxymuconolactone decarboxylase family protein YurZ
MNQIEPVTPEQIRLTDTGLEFAPGVTREDWVRVGEQLSAACKRMQFAIGDWMVYGDNTFSGQREMFGEMGRGVSSTIYDIAADITGLDRQTLRDYAYVARNVPPSLRKDALEYGHYKVLAKLPEPKRREWIALATQAATSDDSRAPSIGQLRHSVRACASRPRLLTREEILASATPKIPAGAEPCVNRLMRELREIERCGVLDDPVKVREVEKLLIPLIRWYQGLSACGPSGIKHSTRS